MYRHRIAGLEVSSDLALPGFAELAPGGEADVVIRRGDVPDDLDGAVDGGSAWAVSPGRFWHSAPRLARYLLSDGARIDYLPDPAAAEGDVAAFILGMAFGVLLQQRGLVVLHASSVAVNQKAVLFVGPSGAGKSTLAAALVRRGYRLIADDVCVLSLDGQGPPLVHPDGGQAKLWAESIDALDLSDRRLRAVRGRPSKFYLDHGDDGLATGPLPLGPVYVLREAGAALDPGIERANNVDAAMIVARAAHRPGVVAKLRQQDLYFQLAAAIGNGDGLHLLTRRLDLRALDESVAELERRWRELADAA